jgi:2-methylfumaryl-CoA isomerase
MSNTLPLQGVRVVEAASFVAAPSAGMTLRQLGADVIRVDPPAGGSDFGRWPLAASGASLFWANLNKGKRSVTIDHRHPEGRELLSALITAPDTKEAIGGIFVDNMVGARRLMYDQLVERRSDLIHVHLEGRLGGKPAVDYSINAEVGVPMMTGPTNSTAPVNHVLPAWDMITGMLVVSAVSSALVRRVQTGEGSRVDIALGDVALAGVASLGWLAEADEAQRPRSRVGNHMFGSFGVDFVTSDGRRVMVVALTEGQWQALRRVTGSDKVFRALEESLNVDLDVEGDRYRLRETIASILRPWFAAYDFAAIKVLLDEAKVLWSPYLDMAEVAAAARCDNSTPITEIEQPGIGPMLASSSPWRWDGLRSSPMPAPTLSANTGQVLGEVLGLTSLEIENLRGRGVV